MNRALALVGLLLGVLLAGCTSAGPSAPTADDCDLEPVLCDPQHYLATHPCITGSVHPRVYAPDTPGPDSAANPWRQGDFWTYRITIDGKARLSTLVYYDDIDFSGGVPQHYLVGTASAEEALDHALFSVNPMLGRIHRALYSPHESGDHADMFGFPLCEGSRWTTTFYGTRFDLAARFSTVTLPGGAQDAGFLIEGRAADGSTLRHTYSPAVRWFSSLDLQRADGLRVQMELTEYGSGKTGTYHFLRAQRDEVLDVGAIGSSGALVGRTDGGEGPYNTLGVWIEAQRTAGTGRIEVHLRDPAGTSRACVGFRGDLGSALSPGCVEGGPLKVQVPYVAGDWKATVESPLGLGSGTRVAGEMRIVSIYDRSGAV
jgi:hypothetical protein